MKRKSYRLLKGLFRINAGIALVRIWSLDKVYPRKTNVHLFDAIRKVKQKNRT